MADELTEQIKEIARLLASAAVKLNAGVMERHNRQPDEAEYRTVFEVELENWRLRDDR